MLRFTHGILHLFGSFNCICWRINSEPMFVLVSAMENKPMPHLYSWNIQTCTCPVDKTILSVEKWSILLPNVLIFVVLWVEPTLLLPPGKDTLSFSFFVQISYICSLGNVAWILKYYPLIWYSNPNPSPPEKSPKQPLF